MSIHIKVLGGWIEIEGEANGGGGGPSGPALEGGEVTTDGDWTVHTFRESDTLTVLREIDVEVLRVAGGGGGGGQGGGAGGLIPPDAPETLTPGEYPVVVGLGGDGGRSRTGGSRGQDTTFNGKTAVGGGLGGGKVSTVGGNGGSGGGSMWANPRHHSTGTPGQGHDSVVFGGGAGSGHLLWNDPPSSGVEVWGEWYASGGTEGVGGASGSNAIAPAPGGGGRGGWGNTAAGSPGVDGTGGGGGGGGFDVGGGTADGPGGKGGDGIVRVRYQQGSAGGGGGDTGGSIAWASISGGAVTSYTDGEGVTWNVHTFNANADVTVESPGIMRGLLVSGGVCGQFTWGNGGNYWEGIVLAEQAGTFPVVVGIGGSDATGNSGRESSALGTHTGAPGASGGTSPGPGVGAGVDGAGAWNAPGRVNGRFSSITGAPVEYARGAASGVAPRPNSGDGANGAAPIVGATGIVILSVPA